MHAVYQRDSANPLHLIHAVSDDGVTWRSGTVIIQDIGTDGGMQDLRVATAPDHVGLVVWQAGLGAGDIRVAAVGPDAPVDPPAGTVTFAASPKSLRVSKHGSLKYSFAVTAPGSGKISLKSTKKVKIGARKTYIKIPAKAYTTAGAGTVHAKLKLSAKSFKALKQVRKLRFHVTVTFNGTPVTTTLKLKSP